MNNVNFIFKQVLLKIKKVLHRITGISSPFFGISWRPSESDRNIARQVVIFLEAKRVLYTPAAFEVEKNCIYSVIEIRNYLTKSFQEIDNPQSRLDSYLRQMRSACNKFLTEFPPRKRRRFRIEHINIMALSVFAIALGELRGVFGMMLSKIESEYGIDVEPQLKEIMPRTRDDHD